MDLSNLDVCFSCKFANYKCTHGTKLRHLKTRLVCSEIIYVYPLKKFAIYFCKIFKDLCTENLGKLPRKI